MDKLTPEQRSRNMSRIRSRDTRPEKLVRSILHHMGFRFRLHRKDLPGRPDIVLPRHHTIILVHGCYWHRHPGCRFAYTPKTNQDFWKTKFKENTARDSHQTHELTALGWRVLTVWECETKHPDTLSEWLHRELLAKPQGEF